MPGAILFIVAPGEATPCCQEITASLARHYGEKSVWQWDRRSAAESLVSAIQQGQFAAVLLAIGPDWTMAAQPALNEVLTTALARRLLIIPVLLDGAAMPPAAAFTPGTRAITRRQAMRVRPGAALDGDVVLLLRAVAWQLGRRPASRVLLWGALAVFVLIFLVPVALLAADPAHTSDAFVTHTSTLVEGAVFSVLLIYALLHAWRAHARRWLIALALVCALWLALLPGAIAAILGVATPYPWWALPGEALGSAFPLAGAIALAVYGLGDAFLVAQRGLSLAAPAQPVGQAPVGSPTSAAAGLALTAADEGNAILNTIFLSYRRDDSQAICDRTYGAYQAAYAHALRRARQARSRWLLRRIYGSLIEQPIFRDVDAIAAGADFLTTLRRAVAGCGAMVVVIGPRWLSLADASGRRLDDPQDVVRFEVGSALRIGKPVHLLLVDGAAKPTASDLPPDLVRLADCRATVLADDASLAKALPYLPPTGWRRRLLMARALVALGPHWGFVALILWGLLMVALRPAPAWVIALVCVPVALWVAPWLVALGAAIIQRRWRWLAILSAPIWAFVAEGILVVILTLAGLAALLPVVVALATLTVLAGFVAILMLPPFFFARVSALHLSQPGRNI